MIIETNQGLERAIEIAKSSPRIDSMILGAVDMSADLRCVKAWEPLLYARSRLVHAAASAGIDLLDVPFLNLDDPDGLAREAQACAQLGFTGKASIHPNQIPIINAAFSPSAAQIAKARKVCKAFEDESERTRGGRQRTDRIARGALLLPDARDRGTHRREAGRDGRFTVAAPKTPPFLLDFFTHGPFPRLSPNCNSLSRRQFSTSARFLLNLGHQPSTPRTSFAS